MRSSSSAICLTLLFAAPSPLNAQQAITVTGVLRIDETSRPCTGARVYVWRVTVAKDAQGNSKGFTIDDIWTAITDSTGHWRIAIPGFLDGNYVFSSDAYSSFIRYKYIARGGRATIPLADDSWMQITCDGQKKKATLPADGGPLLRNGT